MDITSYILGRVAGSSGSNMHYVVVEELPSTGEEGYVYLVPKTSSVTNNYYDEYMYINSTWEKIGDTEIDLTDYQHLFQYAVVPNATADNLGKIIQYTGTTTEYYTNGYFYQCVSNEEETPTYSWTNIEIQANEGEEVIIIENKNASLLFEPDIDNEANRQKLTYILNNSQNIKNMKVYYRDKSNGTTYIPFTILYTEYGDTLKGLTASYWENTSSGSYGVLYRQETSYYLFFRVSGSQVKSIILSKQVIHSPRSNNKIVAIDNTTSWTPTGDYNPVHKKYVDDRVTQYSTVPTANANTVGKIIQYIGTTDSTYTNGYFYIGTTDGTNYSWENLEVQASSGGGGGITTITTDSYIYDLNEGIYFVNANIKLYPYKNNNTRYFYSDSGMVLQIAKKIYDDGYTNHYSCISYRNTNFNNIYGTSGTYTGYKRANALFVGYSDSANSSCTMYPYELFNYGRGTKIDYSSQDGFGVTADTFAYNTYINMLNDLMICKGTLENVITGKELQSKTDIYQLAGLTEYNTSSTYNTGDYCYYNGVIYKCNDDSITGAWDSTKWDSKTYMQYLSDILVGNALSQSY